MYKALIVSLPGSSVAFFKEMLCSAHIDSVCVLSTCSEARRLVMEQDFDLVIVNAPLRDETGEALSRYIASRSLGQVILVVKNEHFEEVSLHTEEDGVLTISKPINKTIFWSALKLAKSASSKLKRIKTENKQLKKQIEDIRVVDKSKCLLISCLGMSEEEAHRYIEKKAMDCRLTKRMVAEDILKTYDC